MPRNTLPPRVGTFASLPSPPLGPQKWAKILWWVATNAAPAIAWTAFDYGVEMFTANDPESTVDADIWTRWRFNWADQISGDNADTQTFKLDVVNFTNGSIDSSWTDADLTFVANQMSSFANAIKPTIADRLICDRIFAYQMAFNPIDYQPDPVNKPNYYPPFVDSGGPIWTLGPAADGTAIGHQASQVSSTITLQTPSRRNWGRIFLPTLGDSAFQTDGRIATSQLTFFVDQLAIVYNTLADQEMYIVVPTTSVDKRRVRTLQNVTALSADDIPDIQRRRRLHAPAMHHQSPAVSATLPAAGAA